MLYLKQVKDTSLLECELKKLKILYYHVITHSKNSIFKTELRKRIKLISRRMSALGHDDFTGGN